MYRSSDKFPNKRPLSVMMRRPWEVNRRYNIVPHCQHETRKQARKKEKDMKARTRAKSGCSHWTGPKMTGSFDVVQGFNGQLLSLRTNDVPIFLSFRHKNEINGEQGYTGVYSSSKKKIGSAKAEEKRVQVARAWLAPADISSWRISLVQSRSVARLTPNIG